MDNSDLAVWNLWQQQAREEHLLPLDDIREKAARLDARTRRWRSFTTLLVALLVIVEAWQVWFGDALLERAGDALTIAAFFYIAYRYRTQRMAAPPMALGTTNSFEFYRAELVRQRDRSKDSWGYLLPFAPGVTLALFGDGMQSLTQTIAIIIFAVGLFVGVAAWNEYTARKLQREIDGLGPSG